MKLKLMLSMAVIAALSLSSCEKFSDKKFSTTIPVIIEVNAPEATSEGIAIDLTNIADVLATNADLAEVQGKIKSYELVQIKYKVYEYYNAPETNFSGTLGFGNKNAETAMTTHALTDFNLKTSMDATDKSVISFTTDDAAKIAQYFKETNALKVFLNGNLSQGPAVFKMYLEVDIDAIAEVEK
jgi:uncharacterized protein YcfL